MSHKILIDSILILKAKFPTLGIKAYAYNSVQNII